MFSREHASFHYLLTNIRVDGTSSLLEGWTRNTSAPSAFSARGNHTRLVVATGRLNCVSSQPQSISTLICVFQILPLVHYNLVGGGENLSWRQFNSWRGWTKLTKLVDSSQSRSRQHQLCKSNSGISQAILTTHLNQGEIFPDTIAKREILQLHVR